jgi:hypothetical protein
MTVAMDQHHKHDAVSYAKERWILLRTIELLARKLVAWEGTPESAGWDQVAVVAYSQATVEHDEPGRVKT